MGTKWKEAKSESTELSCLVLHCHHINEEPWEATFMLCAKRVTGMIDHLISLTSSKIIMQS
jgi:hypothetical protein